METPTDETRLAIYLNDHGGGAAAARRMAREQRHSDWGASLDRVATGIREDERARPPSGARRLGEG